MFHTAFQAATQQTDARCNGVTLPSRRRGHPAAIPGRRGIMLIFQNERNPAAVRHAIIDSLAENMTRISVCSAYVSAGGTTLFTGCCRQYCSDAGFAALPKAVITSFDFGITDPAA